MEKFIEVPVEPEVTDEEEEEPLPPPTKATPDEVFVKPAAEIKEVPPAKAKAKRQASQKQLDHLARIREKSNAARAQRVAEREAKKVATHPAPVAIQATTPTPFPPPLPAQPQMTEARVQEMIQQSIKATREQVERERQAELIIKQKELAELEKKAKQQDMLKHLLKGNKAK